MMRTPVAALALAAASLAIESGGALAAQDRYALAIPNGPSFAEFRGYETWEPVAVSQTETGLKVISANAPMIAAYKAGAPAGTAFPEGSKIVKIEWTTKKSAESPYFVMVPDALKSVSFIEKDSKRFAASGNWGYAQFPYDAASATFKTSGTDAACGYACHTVVKAKDYIFTAYPAR